MSLHHQFHRNHPVLFQHVEFHESFRDTFRFCLTLLADCSGNGTADIVRNLVCVACVSLQGILLSHKEQVPNKRQLPLPPSWAPIDYSSYKPWRDENDASNVFFGSIHLFDDDGSFYPGSGSVAESSTPSDAPTIVNVPLARVLTPAQKQQDCLRSRQGLPPLKRSLVARKTGSKDFRTKVAAMLLPRLKDFNPDIIFLSAGKSLL